MYKKIKNSALIKMFFQFKHYGLFTMSVLISILATVRDLACAITLAIAVDAVINQSSVTQGLIMMAIASLSGPPIKGLESYIHSKYRLCCQRYILNHLAQHVQDISMIDFESYKPGDLIARYTTETERLLSWMSEVFPAAMRLLAYTLGMFIYGMSQSIALTVIVYPVLFIIAHILTRYSHALSDISRKEREAASKFLVKIQETLMNPELVKAFSIEKVMNERANEALNMRAEVEKKATTTLAITNGVAVLGSFVPGFIAAAVGVLFLAKGWITVGFLVSFVQIAITRIGGILNMAADFITSTRRAEASAARVSDMSSLTYERKNGETSLPEATNKVISFKDVSFSYPNKKKALGNISFDINKGETIALVGPSGCGKSTILKLILGFYEAQEGDIYIFERNIKQWNLSALRSAISIVFQDLFLFPVSIRENLMAVKPNASEEELRKAINAAELESFISGLPKNIETIIGERGVNVSGGQRQRLTIARTFIKNSPILLLDEPTSALDSVTEAGLQRSLTRLSEGKTTIIVAHRLKTIRNADRIFVVEKGEIVQIGTHDELIGVEGTYRRLYQKQDEENTGGEEYAS